MFNNLNLGWNNFFQSQIDSNPDFKSLIPARVIIENKNRYAVININGEYEAEISGKLMFSTDDISLFPKVGDWVMIDVYDDNKAIIHYVLDRQTSFSRKVSGSKICEQIIVTNIDYLFIVQSCNENFNLRRLERYLIMATSGRITPVVILSKADLTTETEYYERQILKIIPNIKVISTSTVTNYGINALADFIKCGKTYAFVGSSGAGKSSLINNLLGEDLLKINEIRIKDDRGKHTTTRRELIIMPNSGILIDTPGMREFHLWKTNDGFNEVFSEIDEIANYCKFGDCKHINETGCAVINAVKEGIITLERYNSYIKLLKEEEYLELKDNKEYFLQKKDKEKKLSKLQKENYKYRDKYKI